MSDNEFATVKRASPASKKFIEDCKAAGGGCELVAEGKHLASEISTTAPDRVVQTRASNPDYNTLFVGFDAALNFFAQGLEAGRPRRPDQGVRRLDRRRRGQYRDDPHAAASRPPPPAFAMERVGYGLIDNLNRLFNGQAAVDQGVTVKIINARTRRPDRLPGTATSTPTPSYLKAVGQVDESPPRRRRWTAAPAPSSRSGSCPRPSSDSARSTEVDFDLRAGEVHALLGENGSGKSTLIKCLAGYYEPDHGARARARRARRSPCRYQPSQATRLGLVFVHQDLGLIPNLSVAENFAIVAEVRRGLARRIPWKAIRPRASRAELKALGHDIDAERPVGRLSVAEQTIVAIARALASAEEGAKVLVLDEPTAALPDARRTIEDGSATRSSSSSPPSARSWPRASASSTSRTSSTRSSSSPIAPRSCATAGRSRPSTSRDSPRGTWSASSSAGRSSTSAGPRDAAQAGERLLACRGLQRTALQDVSFTVDRGEVIGVAGMLGSGRSELARMLFGAQQPDRARSRCAASAVRLAIPRDAVRRGVALIPEDRRRQGGLLDMSVAHNLTLPSIGRLLPATAGSSAGEERARVRELIADYRHQPAVPSRKFRVLSGGNQQKVVIAKWMSISPDLVIFDEPVQGVDVGARAEIYELVVTGRRRRGRRAADLLGARPHARPLRLGCWCCATGA